MSRPNTTRIPASAPIPARRPRARSSAARVPAVARRPSVSALGLSGGINPVTGAPKAQRTSKTVQKLVLLPSEPQTRPLPTSDDEDLQHGYETDRGIRDIKSEGERMSKEQRKKAGYKRITAYCVAEAFKMKLLATYLKREHNVQPRVFDEAMYVMYHLPLLPGYGPNSNIRSSAPPSSEDDDVVVPVSELEDQAYLNSVSSSPLVDRLPPATSVTPITDVHPEHFDVAHEEPAEFSLSAKDENNIAEVVFFSYGVVVFFGLDENQERGILEDIQAAGATRRVLEEDKWEIEECHYAYDRYIAYPRIYNDFFTFKSHSTLSILSVSHALAQSTLLARYETLTNATLSSPDTKAIPQRLATTGSLHLSRTEALKITGRLFKVRRDVNLVSNVLDVPDIFWEEGQANVRALYDAVREYLEIGSRVNVLNEKLAVAEDLLGAIHDHLNYKAMDRITWIIIWLIVVACLVEVGEVIARLVFHASKVEGHQPGTVVNATAALAALSKEEALRILERMMEQS
ncbi:hypothetical protein C8Q75DRAFT_752676 [Abortiporus biennis]|nr:hypothetical protein C8Q75DRAFT_752676 [Abortiporus biennis]